MRYFGNPKFDAVTRYTLPQSISHLGVFMLMIFHRTKLITVLPIA